tara:strand:+ start:647 stop:805 length:159 start_codon:yes stop_codon:yes gene_type:complete
VLVEAIAAIDRDLQACSSDDEKKDDGECKEMPGLADMEDNSSLPVKGNHDSR